MAGKITKQELKEPDKFQVILSRTLTYIAENKKKLYLIGAAFTAVFVIAAVWYFYELNMNRSAQKIYSRTYTTAVNDPAAAIAVYKEVLDKYPRSRVATLADYRLAGLFYQQNDFDAAIKHYESFLSNISDKSELKTIAYMGLGHCYEAKKDYQKAIAAFEKAAASKAGHLFESINNQNLARIYEALNDRARALEYYQKALAKNTNPITELILKRRIATLS